MVPDRRDSSYSRLAFVLYLLFINAAWTIWVLFGYPRLRVLGEDTLLYALANLAVRGLIWVLPVFVYLRYVDGVNPTLYLKLRQHWRRGVLVALGFSLVNLSITLAQRGSPHVHAAAFTWNSILSTSLLIGFFEEVPY